MLYMLRWVSDRRSMPGHSTNAYDYEIFHFSQQGRGCVDDADIQRNYRYFHAVQFTDAAI